MKSKVKHGYDVQVILVWILIKIKDEFYVYPQTMFCL